MGGDVVRFFGHPGHFLSWKQRQLIVKILLLILPMGLQRRSVEIQDLCIRLVNSMFCKTFIRQR